MKNYFERNSKTVNRILIFVKGLTASLATMQVVQENYKASTIITIVGFVVTELLTAFSSDKKNEEIN